MACNEKFALKSILLMHCKFHYGKHSTALLFYWDYVFIISVVTSVLLFLDSCKSKSDNVT
jgi:hypothetical protein